MSLRRGWESWFSRSKTTGSKKVEFRPGQFSAFRAKELRFFGGQDGPVEQELKKRLMPVLEQHPEVRRAYLARVGYGVKSQETSVALCLRSDKKSEKLARELVGAFVDMFSSKVHMDVAFINERQEKQLAPLCPPFYGGSP